MNSVYFNYLLRTIKESSRSLETIYNFYYKKIVYHIGKKYGRAFAEEVAMGFFEWLLSANIKKYISYPTTWIYINCESIAKRKLTKEKKVDLLGDNEIKSDDIISKELLYGDLYNAIRDLPETDQKILDLYYWEGYKLKEIAVILNMKYDAVAQRHGRLIKKLKKILGSVNF